MEVFVGDVCQFLTGSKGVCGPMVGEKSNRAAIDISFRPHGFAFTIAEHFEAVRDLLTGESCNVYCNIRNIYVCTGWFYCCTQPAWAQHIVNI